MTAGKKRTRRDMPNASDDRESIETRAQGPEERRRGEIVSEFERVQLSSEDPTAPFLRYAPTRKDYRPLRLRSPKKSEAALINEAMFNDVPVPDDLRFAAKKIVEAFADIAEGRGQVPRLVPDDRERVQGYIGKHQGLADGTRRWFESDRRKVAAMFREVFGASPARYWEIVLERALRDALVMRRLFPEEAQVFESGGVRLEVPSRPTAADVLAVVREHCLPPTVPDFLTADVIDVAFEQCTDAERGGGRGERKKISVRRWIADLKRKVGETRAPKAR